MKLDLIENGTNKTEVVKIMGIPNDRKNCAYSYFDRMFYYEPPFASSDGVFIYFDTLNRVTQVVRD